MPPAPKRRTSKLALAATASMPLEPASQRSDVINEGEATLSKGVSFAIEVPNGFSANDSPVSDDAHRPKGGLGDVSLIISEMLQMSGSRHGELLTIKSSQESPTPSRVTIQAQDFFTVGEGPITYQLTRPHAPLDRGPDLGTSRVHVMQPPMCARPALQPQRCSGCRQRDLTRI